MIETPVLARYGPQLVFMAVFLDQLGLPIPSVPLLLACSASAARAEETLAPLLFAATLSSLLADSGWYALGRWQGKRILGFLWRLTPRPDRAQAFCERSLRHHRLVSLAAAKFFPGIATVAPPLAGALGVPFGAFALVSLLSGLAWAGGLMAIGWFFRDSIGEAIRYLEALGSSALVLTGLLVIGYIAIERWRRQRLTRKQLPITVDEHHDAGSGSPTLEISSPTSRG